MLRAAAVVLTASGLVCLALFADGHVAPQRAAADAVAQFEARDAGPEVPAPHRSASFEALVPDAPDTSSWSAVRRLAFETGDAPAATLGVLRIDRLGVVAPIYAGAGDATLDAGIGLIEGSARLDEIGNVGLAAHRDGFFRPLKDIRRGDSIELVTSTATRRYIVTATEIVAPAEVSVLRPTPVRVLTLVTCHPFYFVGDAPDRFVVRAVSEDHDPA